MKKYTIPKIFNRMELRSMKSLLYTIKLEMILHRLRVGMSKR